MGANRGTPERTEAIVALPQNHDWYDNLSTFARYFVGDPDRTKPLKRFLDRIPVMQRSTYFAVALPHDWWIIGLDFAFTDDIDRNQFESFVGLAEQVGPQARFILVYPEPFWVKDDASTRNIGRPKRCQRLEARIGIDRIRLRIAGDLHQFSDEVSERGVHLVTCGTGGAFLQPTHTADVQAPKIARLENNDLAMINDPAWRNFVRVRTGESGARAAAKEKALPDSRHYSVETGYRYPLPAVSRAMARQLPFKFGWCNWKFALIIGVVYSLGAWLNGFLLGAEIGEFGLPRLATRGWAGIGGDALNWIGAMILFMPSALLNMLTILVFVAFSREQRPVFMSIGGLLHSAAHGIAVFLLYWCAIYMLSTDGVKSDPHVVQTVFLIAVWMIVAGAVVGSIIFGTFLLIAVSGFGQHQHEAFAALRVEDYKGFLRFKIDTDGVLSGYFVQIDCVCRRWRKTGNDQTQPVWMPDDGQADMASVKHTFRIERQPLV